MDVICSGAKERRRLKLFISLLSSSELIYQIIKTAGRRRRQLICAQEREYRARALCVCATFSSFAVNCQCGHNGKGGSRLCG